ncbi:hypothetical protein, partial [Paenibacillus sp. FSL R7-269]|uniref:hypothetical protein n=1 Tax=Paenibacillus sp. FSL R7-269 TaxID=1226755 RepID=UPI001F44B44C
METVPDSSKTIAKARNTQAKAPSAFIVQSFVRQVPHKTTLHNLHPAKESSRQPACLPPARFGPHQPVR